MPAQDTLLDKYKLAHDMHLPELTEVGTLGFARRQGDCRSTTKAQTIDQADHSTLKTVGFPKLSTNTHSGEQASSRRPQWLRQPNTGPESYSEIVGVKDTRARETRQQLAHRGLGHWTQQVARGWAPAFGVGAPTTQHKLDSQNTGSEFDSNRGLGKWMQRVAECWPLPYASVRSQHGAGCTKT